MWRGGFLPFSSHWTPFLMWPGGVKPSSSCQTPIVSNAATQCSNDMTQCDNNTTQHSIDTTQCGNDTTHSGSDTTNAAMTQVPPSPPLLETEHPSYPMQHPNAATTRPSLTHIPSLAWNARRRGYILFYFPQPVLHPLPCLKCEMEVNFPPTDLAWVASPPLLEMWDGGIFYFPPTTGNQSPPLLETWDREEFPYFILFLL